MTVIDAKNRFIRRGQSSELAGTAWDIPVTMRKGRSGKLSSLAQAKWLASIWSASIRAYPAARFAVAMYYDDKSCSEATIYIDIDAAGLNGCDDTPQDAQINVEDCCVLVTFEGVEPNFCVTA